MEAKFARINMIDFVSEGALEETQNRYAKIREKTYPGLQFTVNVRTGPQSMMSLSIYESEAALTATTENHKQFIASTSDLVKDIFFYEGAVTALASTLVTDGMVTFGDES
jgi:hypothetical protein